MVIVLVAHSILSFDEKHYPMQTENVERRFEVRDVEGLVGGGLLGALLGGGLANLVDHELVLHYAELVGSTSMEVAWLVLLALGVVFAIPFESYLERTFNGFVSALVGLTRRSRVLRALLAPLVKRSPMGVVCYALGQGYGLLVGVVFYVFLLPLWLDVVMGVAVPFPYLTLHGLVAVIGWMVYGSMLGLVYGVTVEA